MIQFLVIAACKQGQDGKSSTRVTRAKGGKAGKAGATSGSGNGSWTEVATLASGRLSSDSYLIHDQEGDATAARKDFSNQPCSVSIIKSGNVLGLRTTLGNRKVDVAINGVKDLTKIEQFEVLAENPKTDVRVGINPKYTANFVSSKDASGNTIYQIDRRALVFYDRKFDDKLEAAEAEKAETQILTDKTISKISLYGEKVLITGTKNNMKKITYKRTKFENGSGEKVAKDLFTVQEGIVETGSMVCNLTTTASASDKNFVAAPDSTNTTGSGTGSETAKTQEKAKSR